MGHACPTPVANTKRKKSHCIYNTCMYTMYNVNCMLAHRNTSLISRNVGKVHDSTAHTR